MKQTDSSDTKPVKKTAPRPRRKPAGTGYEVARQEFEQRAQRWMLGRPGKTFSMPGDLNAVAALGVPCEKCGKLTHRDREAGHRISWRQSTGTHWASGITATCATS